MHILIVSATKEEIPRWFVQHAVQEHSQSFPQLTIDTLITGPGINHTAFWLGRWLANKTYDIIVNVGIAGSFNTVIPLGAVVSVVKDRFADFGYTSPQGFTDASTAGLLSPVGHWLSADGWLHASEDVPHAVPLPFAKVNGITVQTVTGDSASIERMQTLYQPDIETMEGAAFLYACHQSGTRSVCIRSISNYVEPRNKSNWNIPLAVQELDKAIFSLLNLINQSV